MAHRINLRRGRLWFSGPSAIFWWITRRNLELIPQGIGSDRLNAIHALKLRSLGAVYCVLPQHRVTADWHNRLKTPVASDPNRQVHVTLDVRYLRHARIGRWGQLGQCNSGMGHIRGRSRLRMGIFDQHEGNKGQR